MNDSDHLAVCVIAAAGAALLIYIAANESGGQLTAPERDRESPGTDFHGLNSPTALVRGDQPGGYQSTGHEWRVPCYDEDTQNYVQTRHRYPAISGANISAVIHSGWSAMMRPAPHDADWIEAPPSEVQF